MSYNSILKIENNLTTKGQQMKNLIGSILFIFIVLTVFIKTSYSAELSRYLPLNTPEQLEQHEICMNEIDLQYKEGGKFLVDVNVYDAMMNECENETLNTLNGGM